MTYIKPATQDLLPAACEYLNGLAVETQDD
jgi:hypothetical protein